MNDRTARLGPLSEPAAGVPLRVAAYMRISDAIRSGELPSSSLLPSEAELVQELGVSRTVVREALILLEEDGLLRSRRGIGRFVSDQIPQSGLERLAPFEQLIAPGSAVTVQRLTAVLQEQTSAFPAEFLQIPGAGESWFVESLIRKDGAPAALNQEHLPGPELLTGALAPLAELLKDLPEHSTVMGAAAAAGLRFGASHTEMTVGTPGPTRGELMGLDADEPVLILVRRLTIAAHPALVSKTLINTHETTLTIRHGAS